MHIIEYVGAKREPAFLRAAVHFRDNRDSLRFRDEHQGDHQLRGQFPLHLLGIPGARDDNPGIPLLDQGIEALLIGFSLLF